MRLALARVLLSRPDVLLLDEPTNHLDIAGVEWLESYLKKYKGAVMVVSHDRRFLDNLADKIFELEDGKVTVYRGNFSAYLSQKEEALRRQEELFREQQELIQRTRAFIQKWKANANRTGQAKSREKMLERLEMIEKPKSEKKLKMKLTFEDFPGRDVLRIDALSPCFNGEQSGQVKLFEDFSCLIQRGERVALVGPNGCGKTTFLECIQGLKSFEGEVKWGSGVVIGYLPQETLFPSREEKVIDEIKSMGLQEREARDILGRFLFSGDDVEKKVGDLSGGEKKRLHLAKLVLSGANVLLLDEPTNHLDIASREALEKAVLDFGGTCIFASHDRYLIDKIATRIFFFKDGRIIDFRGNYSLFLEREESTRGSSRGETQVAEISRNPRNKNKMEKKSACDPSGTDRQILQGYLQDIESKIFALESREKELIALLSDSRTYMNDSSLSDSPENVRPGSGASDVGSLLAEYAEIKESLEHLYAEWEKLVEESSDEPGEV